MCFTGIGTTGIFTVVACKLMDSPPDLLVNFTFAVPRLSFKVHVFGDILDATVDSIPVNGENVEVTQTFTSLGNEIDDWGEPGAR